MTEDLSRWTPPSLPGRMILRGRYATLEPLNQTHIPGLWQAQSDPETWRYIPVGPFATEAEFAGWVSAAAGSDDPLHFAVRMQDGRLGGTLSFLRIAPSSGSIELGYIVFTPRLQKTREATEAVYLTMKWAFETGYRRFEWKCDAKNLPSRRAAGRFGLSYEGLFRQHMIVKGRNRDTAWFAAVDTEWPALCAAFETWLDPANFDAAGRQRVRLSDLTDPILAARDPALG